MNSTQMASEQETPTPSAETVDLKLEAIVIPVSDVDRAKRFYSSLGWRLDADWELTPTFRVLQFTPPGSPSSIIFGKGVTAVPPGQSAGLYLVVFDIEKARAALLARGIDVSQAFHFGENRERVPGPDPQRRSYFTWASFDDPDGNQWLLQEIKVRLPGRV